MQYTEIFLQAPISAYEEPEDLAKKIFFRLTFCHSLYKFKISLNIQDQTITKLLILESFLFKNSKPYFGTHFFKNKKNMPAH